jgi:hypothetical protein
MEIYGYHAQTIIYECAMKIITIKLNERQFRENTRCNVQEAAVAGNIPPKKADSSFKYFIHARVV